MWEGPFCLLSPVPILSGERRDQGKPSEFDHEIRGVCIIGVENLSHSAQIIVKFIINTIIDLRNRARLIADSSMPRKERFSLGPYKPT